MKKNYINLNLLKGIILGFIGGFIELYSLLIRDAFCGMQTGNLIYSILNLIDGDFKLMAYHLMIILTFIIGIISVEVIYRLSKKFKFNDKHLIYPLMVIFIIPSIFIPTNLDIFDPLNILSIITLTLFGAFQAHVFTNLNNHNLSTTMMTMMIKQTFSKLFNGIMNKNKDDLYISMSSLLVILTFIFGIALFYLLFIYIDIKFINYFLVIIIFLIINIYIIDLYKLSFSKWYCFYNYEYGNYDGGYFNVLEEITINYNGVIDLYSFDYSSNKPCTSYLMIYYKGQHLKVSRDSDGDGIYQGHNASEYRGYYKFDDLSKEWIQVPKPE